MKGRLKWIVNKGIEFVFFGNYFYALCVLSLAIEASLQQSIELNSPSFYLLLGAATVVYYTYAYMGEISFKVAFLRRKIKLTTSSQYNYYNLRTHWYHQNSRLLNISQIVLSGLVLYAAFDLAILRFHHIFSLTFSEWVMLISVPVVALLYYGNEYFPMFKINLRKTGWVKPFVIGFVWAGVVTIYPPLFRQWQLDLHYSFNFLVLWLFIKNWMYVSVLAIMFDIKDYADDANREVKTFVVRVGLRKTIFRILLPLIIIGLISFTIFAYEKSFGLMHYLINLVPFILLLIVAYSMHRRRPILYYLFIIDGLMLVKGICGILGVVLFNKS
ncbi:MAG: UbiA family prenyltransferase [Chitinophagaceae bacterium]|nr:UbiA family prenyltransferase [Chitinophagaceae bacterium]MCW5914382.1 UbiA family prenyltransferase [Chitinophagaceae bacterium]MCZ2396630.1 UbiA family prenyltransferase [Chitinophagales bacterium]